MKKILLIIITLLSTNACAFGSYEYFAIQTLDSEKLKLEGGESIAEEYVYIDTKTQTIDFNGLATNYFSCENKSMICITGTDLSFVISKKWDSNKTSWEYDGVKFKYLGDTIDINEEVIFHKFLSVDAKDRYNNSVVYYSKKRGIVGFTILHEPDEYQVTYWSKDYLGFGNE